jgi:2-iminobutanoate/2-iminopropanoate deaminase
MKKIISTDKAPKAVGPYNQAVEANGFIFLSGQIPIDPEAGQITGKNIEEQAEQVLKNIGQVLKAAGCDYKNVVKTTVFLTDLLNFKAINEAYIKYFGTESPARSTIEVSDLPMGAMVEIECIAIKS